MPDTPHTPHTRTYEGWDTISVNLSKADAVAECRQRGITFHQFGQEVESHWQDMYPGTEPPKDLALDIEDELVEEEHRIELLREEDAVRAADLLTDGSDEEE